MNFALSAILIVIFLIPGAAVLRTYLISFTSKQTSSYIPFNELLFRGLLISFVIHGLGIFLLLLWGRSPKFDLIYHIISAKDLVINDLQFAKDFINFSIYNLSLIFSGILVTSIFKHFCDKYNWDIKFHFLKRSNYWFLVFSAKYLELENIPGQERDTYLIYMEVLCDNDMMYSGLLTDFNYSPFKDELENVILQYVKKRVHIKDLTPRPLENPPAVDQAKPDDNAGKEDKLTIQRNSKIVDVPGDRFLIPASTIVNFNLKYLNLESFKN